MLCPSPSPGHGRRRPARLSMGTERITSKTTSSIATAASALLLTCMDDADDEQRLLPLPELHRLLGAPCYPPVDILHRDVLSEVADHLADRWDLPSLAAAACVSSAWRDAFAPSLWALPAQLAQAVNNLMSTEELRRPTLWRQRRKSLLDDQLTTRDLRRAVRDVKAECDERRPHGPHGLFATESPGAYLIVPSVCSGVTESVNAAHALHEAAVAAAAEATAAKAAAEAAKAAAAHGSPASADCSEARVSAGLPSSSASDDVAIAAPRTDNAPATSHPPLAVDCGHDEQSSDDDADDSDGEIDGGMRRRRRFAQRGERAFCDGNRATAFLSRFNPNLPRRKGRSAVLPELRALDPASVDEATLLVVARRLRSDPRLTPRQQRNCRAAHLLVSWAQTVVDEAFFFRTEPEARELDAQLRRLCRVVATLSASRAARNTAWGALRKRLVELGLEAFILQERPPWAPCVADSATARVAGANGGGGERMARRLQFDHVA